MYILQQLNFEPSIVVDLYNLDGSLFEGSLQGTDLAWFIVKWAMTLRRGHRMMQTLIPWHTQAWLYPGVYHGLNCMWISFSDNIFLFAFPARLKMFSVLITFRMRLRYYLRTSEVQWRNARHFNPLWGAWNHCYNVVSFLSKSKRGSPNGDAERREPHARRIGSNAAGDAVSILSCATHASYWARRSKF